MERDLESYTYKEKEREPLPRGFMTERKPEVDHEELGHLLTSTKKLQNENDLLLHFIPDNYIDLKREQKYMERVLQEYENKL